MTIEDELRPELTPVPVWNNWHCRHRLLLTSRSRSVFIIIGGLIVFLCACLGISGTLRRDLWRDHWRVGGQDLYGRGQRSKASYDDCVWA